MASEADIDAAAAAIRRLMDEPGLDQAGPRSIAMAALEAAERARSGSRRLTLSDWSPNETDWDNAARLYAQTRHWSRHFGPDPESPACRCPRAILAKWKIDAEILR